MSGVTFIRKGGRIIPILSHPYVVGAAAGAITGEIVGQTGSKGAAMKTGLVAGIGTVGAGHLVLKSKEVRKSLSSVAKASAKFIIKGVGKKVGIR
jgi:hypothetical protein